MSIFEILMVYAQCSLYCFIPSEVHCIQYFVLIVTNVTMSLESRYVISYVTRHIKSYPEIGIAIIEIQAYDSVTVIMHKKQMIEIRRIICFHEP